MKVVAEWKASRKAILAAWRQSLPPETRALMDAAWAAARNKSIERREQRAARLRKLVSLTLDGFAPSEIAEKTGDDYRETRRRLAALGVPATKQGMRRIPVGHVKVEILEALAKIADERGVDVRTTLETLLTFALESNEFHARRILGMSVPRQSLLRVA